MNKEEVDILVDELEKKIKKINVDCPKKSCISYGGYGALKSADPLNQGTCLRGNGFCRYRKKKKKAKS